MNFPGASLTIVGRVATAPASTSHSSGDRTAFRIISTERRLDRESKQWVDGAEYSVGVVCWGSVASGVAKTVRLGDPVVIIGRLSHRKVDRESGPDYYHEVRGDVVALDVARTNGRIARADDQPPVSGPVTDATPIPDVPAGDELDPGFDPTAPF